VEFATCAPSRCQLTRSARSTDRSSPAC
jgi:hypothetical protein